MSRRAPDEFAVRYARLNRAQKRAVDEIEGPVLVVAGPGTGKTQILTLRIANILRQTDTPPDAILALTFTNAGVRAMRERLVGIVGSRAYRVPIHTFHSLANDLIRRYPEKFPRIIGSTNALPIDQIRLLEAVIEKESLEQLRPFGDPFHYLFAILSEIARLKREAVSPARLGEIVAAEEASLLARADLRHARGPYRGRIKGEFQTQLIQIAKARELQLVYEAYERELAVAQLYDFGDMLLEVLRALEGDEDFRLTIQEEYQYVLADEHQDANQSQNRLLELLSSFHANPNLFIVGDDKQAIFQFQGASLDNFNYFKKLFPRAKLIKLVDNYRSSQLILDAARGVAQHSVGLPRASLGRLRAARSARRAAPIELRAFSTVERELDWLAQDLKTVLAKQPNATAAVIYRTNAEAEPIVAALERVGVPFVVRSESDILTDLDLQKLLLLWRALHRIGDDQALLELLHVDFLGLDLLEVYELAAQAKRREQSLWFTLRQTKRRPFKKLVSQLERWAKLGVNQNFLEVFGVVVRESGFLEHLLKLPEALEKLNKLHALADEITKLARHQSDLRLNDFIKFLNTLATHRLSLPRRSAAGRAGVELLTAHKAKGLEFDLVYLVGATDGHWGNRRVTAPFKIPTRATLTLDALEADKNDAERRLFYVALTRARQAIKISWSQSGEDDRPELPSQFIEEIAPRFKRLVEMGAWEGRQAAQPALLFSPRVHQGARIFAPDYLAARFREQGFSATGLNTYLRCPLDYLFSHLLRVLETRNRHTSYGTAVHGALEDFFNRWRQDETVPKEVLLVSFERLLGREPLSERDGAAARARGARALGGWYDAWAGTPSAGGWPRAIINEYKIRGCHLSPDLKLVGKIDKLEFGDGQAVRVVDYKTMVPKSRNEIMGRTKSSTGDIYRQLVFYKLLLEESEKKRFVVEEVMIDFVEPTARGQYKREAFVIAADEVAELRATLERVAREITSGEFLTRGCGRPDCRGCQLEKLMK